MSRLIKRKQFDKAETFVFWDMSGCKIPSGVDAKTVYENIKSALANEGYTGNVSITVYAKDPIRKNLLPPELFTLLEGSGKLAFRITAALFRWGTSRGEERSNLMIISDQIVPFYLGAIEFLGAQENINVLVAQEDPRPPRELTRITSEVWLWRSLSTTGGKPVYSIDNIWTRIGSGCEDPSQSCENTWRPNPDNYFVNSTWNPDNLSNWNPNGLKPGSSGPALDPRQITSTIIVESSSEKATD